MVELRFNCRLSDFNCSLAASQATTLSGWVKRRQGLAARYDELPASVEVERTPVASADRTSESHLCAVRIENVYPPDPEQRRYSASGTIPSSPTNRSPTDLGKLRSHGYRYQRPHSPVYGQRGKSREP